MSSEAFILSTARNPDPAAALAQALEMAALSAAQVQDLVMGLDDLGDAPGLEAALHAAGLDCPTVRVAPGLRAVFVAAASILSDEVTLPAIVLVEHDAFTVLLLASAEAVGRLNLFPRARLAAHSLSGRQAAVRQAGLEPADLDDAVEDENLGLHDLLGELESRPARWGLLARGDMVLLLERL